MKGPQSQAGEEPWGLGLAVGMVRRAFIGGGLNRVMMSRGGPKLLRPFIYQVSLDNYQFQEFLQH